MRYLAVWAIYFSIGILLALSGILPPFRQRHLFLMLLAVGIAFLSFWPHAVLHEAGHALAGLARGMRAVAFGAGRLRLVRVMTGWRWRREKSIPNIGGFALLVPGSGRELSKIDGTILLLGGALANFLTGFCLVWLAGTAVSPWWKTVLIICGGTAFFLGGMSLLPRCVHGWRWDGKAILDLWRNAPDALLQWKLYRILAISLDGVRPRDWPAELLDTVDEEAGASPLMQISVAVLQMSRLIDRGDIDAAGNCAYWLAPRYWQLPDGNRQSVAFCLAKYAVMIHDEKLLAAWRPLCEGGLLDCSYMLFLLDAEYSLLQEKHEEARRYSAQARAMLHNVCFPGDSAVLKDRLNMLDAKLKERAASEMLPGNAEQGQTHCIHQERA